MRLKNKISIITSAGRGMGRSIANELELVRSRRALFFETEKGEGGVQ